MDPTLADFLAEHTPIAQGRVVWPVNGGEFVQTCTTFEIDRLPPLALVTSVRAIVYREEMVLVVQDPESEHIVPGGRVEDGETVEETLARELLEETGWTIQQPPTLFGLFHYHILSPKPANYRYPYPDYVQLIYRAEAERHFPEAIEADGYERGAAFRPLADVHTLSLSPGETALLQRLDESRRIP